MKKKFILWFLVLALLLPVVAVPGSASRDEHYDDYIEPMSLYEHFYLSKSDHGSLSFMVDSRNYARGIIMALYPASITGQESREALRTMAIELIEDDADTVLQKDQLSNMSFKDLFFFELDGAKLETGSYLFAAYLYKYSSKDGSLFDVEIYPDFDTLYVTDVYVVDEPVPATGANIYLCDKYGENREPVTALEFDLDMKWSTFFLCADLAPFNSTGGFYLDFIQMGTSYPVGPDRMFPNYMTCGYPITVYSCGTGILGAVWRSSSTDTEYQIGPFPITVTVPCKPDESNAEVTREHTATQPGELTAPARAVASLPQCLMPLSLPTPTPTNTTPPPWTIATSSSCSRVPVRISSAPKWP